MSVVLDEAAHTNNELPLDWVEILIKEFVSEYGINYMLLINKHTFPLTQLSDECLSLLTARKLLAHIQL